jgi:hypothetical protein
VDAGDPLFQNRRIPGEIEIDDGIGRLEIQAGGPGIGGEKKASIRFPLKPGDQRLTPFLRDGTVQPDVFYSAASQQRFDEIQHRRPF